MATQKTIKTSPELNEGALTANRIIHLKEKPIKGNYDAEHLKAINRYLLQDIPMYNGGQYRISSGEHVRSRSMNNGEDSYVVHYKYGGVSDKDINNAMKAFGRFDEVKAMPQAEVSARLSKLYADLDHIHPFNEANSRTLRLYTEQVAKEVGYKLDWTKTNQNVNARDTLYMARDLEVSKRSHPDLSIDRMRDATRSQYEAYETQKRLGGSKSLESIIRENLTVERQQVMTKQSPYQAGKERVQGQVTQQKVQQASITPVKTNESRMSTAKSEVNFRRGK
jgi:cell filamentation protein